MKNLIFVCLLSISFIGTTHAQFKLGLKAGVSTYDMKLNDFVVKSGDDFNNLTNAIDNSSFGYQFGGFLRLGRGLHIQPEFLFNTNRVELESTNDNGSFTTTETFNNVDIPILLGIKLGPLHAQAGPVGRFYLGSDEQVAKVIDNYQVDEDRLKLGFQAGFGIDLWRLSVDFRYEGNLKHFGNAINIDGKAFALDNKAGRVVASVGIAF